MMAIGPKFMAGVFLFSGVALLAGFDFLPVFLHRGASLAGGGSNLGRATSQYQSRRCPGK
jgi:hypothetical protein